MSDNSTIEWTDATWGPTLGCTRVSPGCDACYAIRTATIRAGNPNPKVAEAFAGLTERRDGRLDWTGQVNLLPTRLDQPLRWRKPRRIFVDSQSDLFHDAVPDGFIGAVFDVMRRAEQHTFQVLTKRHGRMRSLLNRWARGDMPVTPFDRNGRSHGGCVVTTPWEPPNNIWLGVSVEDQKRADLRIPALLDTPAAVRWLSCEPLLGPVDLTCGNVRPGFHGPCDGYCEGALIRGIDWIVAGGESGPGARPMHPAWARQLRDQCEASGAPFHFKQRGAWSWTSPRWPAQDWATNPDRNAVVYLDGRVEQVLHAGWNGTDAAIVYRVGKKAAGRELDGVLHDAMPERAR